MNLLVVSIIFILALDAATAWILSTSARWLKSPRARFGVGLFVVVTTTVISLLFTIAVTRLNPASSIVLCAAYALQVVVIVVLLKKLFKLPFLPTLGLFGIYILCSFAQLAVALFVFRPYVGEAFVLPTPSMAPTLNAGDRILVNKLEHPQRWNLIVYKVPGMSGPSCKRLVGLPGEQLKFDNGILYVNDAKIEMPPVVSSRYRMLSFMKYEDGETITLGNDEFFVIGDNVDRSYDSRVTGPAKWSSLIGVVDVLYWPMDRFKILK